MLSWLRGKDKKESAFSDSKYKRQRLSLQRSQDRLASVVKKQLKILAAMDKELRNAQDEVQVEIEQVDGLIRQYKKECDRLRDENDVQGSTISAMVASQNSVLQMWRKQAAIHAIGGQLANSQGE